MMNREDWPAPARRLVLTHFLTVRMAACVGPSRPPGDQSRQWPARHRRCLP